MDKSTGGVGVSGVRHPSDPVIDSEVPFFDSEVPGGERITLTLASNRPWTGAFFGLVEDR